MFGEVKMKKYKLNQRSSKLFIVGPPLIGKTTLASHLTSIIIDMPVVSMDIVRIFAQLIENEKLAKLRNKFVQYGSCDSYTLVGDGTFKKENIINGYKAYAKAVFNPITNVIPKLETQGCENVIFEGVQLMPELVAPYLGKNCKLIVLKSNPDRFNQSKKNLFEDNKILHNRYNNVALSTIQTEILKQASKIDSCHCIVIDNSFDKNTLITNVIKVLKEMDFINEQ